MKGKTQEVLRLVKLCCQALDAKKAIDLRVLDVSAQSSITDYLVLATGTSEPHLRALRVELEKAIDSSPHRILGMETAQESGWVVVDVFDGKTKRSLWRGTASGTLQSDPERMNVMLQAALDKMFATFPPK